MAVCQIFNPLLAIESSVADDNIQLTSYPTMTCVYFPDPMRYVHKLTLMMIAQRETERLDFQHHIFAMTFDGKLQIAPLPEKLNRVLDIGTGTGIWAIDFADENPDTQVGT